MTKQRSHHSSQHEIRQGGALWHRLQQAHHVLTPHHLPPFHISRNRLRTSPCRSRSQTLVIYQYKGPIRPCQRLRGQLNHCTCHSPCHPVPFHPQQAAGAGAGAGAWLSWTCLQLRLPPGHEPQSAARAAQRSQRVHWQQKQTIQETRHAPAATLSSVPLPYAPPPACIQHCLLPAAACTHYVHSPNSLTLCRPTALPHPKPSSWV